MVLIAMLTEGENFEQRRQMAPQGWLASWISIARAQKPSTGSSVVLQGDVL